MAGAAQGVQEAAGRAESLGWFHRGKVGCAALAHPRAPHPPLSLCPTHVSAPAACLNQLPENTHPREGSSRQFPCACTKGSLLPTVYLLVARSLRYLLSHLAHTDPLGLLPWFPCCPTCRARLLSLHSCLTRSTSLPPSPGKRSALPPAPAPSIGPRDPAVALGKAVLPGIGAE